MSATLRFAARQHLSDRDEQTLAWLYRDEYQPYPRTTADQLAGWSTYAPERFAGDDTKPARLKRVTTSLHRLQDYGLAIPVNTGAGKPARWEATRPLCFAVTIVPR